MAHAWVAGAGRRAFAVASSPALSLTVRLGQFLLSWVGQKCMEAIKTFKLRIKDKHAKAMLAMARYVNTVWNFCNETQFRSLKRYCNRPKVWLSGWDLYALVLVQIGKGVENVLTCRISHQPDSAAHVTKH
ncbi:hypothetical protein ACQUFY_25340 (plasmid) [Robbsia andropogonis]|uniref:hypothetical protein n=1 Tax=Robbsia andropogonis TaxID=28092 RepID=UPI003D25C7CF